MGWKNWLLRTKPVEADLRQEKMDLAEQKIYEKDVKRLNEAKIKVNERKVELQSQLLDILRQELVKRESLIEKFDSDVLNCSVRDYLKSERLNPGEYELRPVTYWVQNYPSMEDMEESIKIGIGERLKDLGAKKCCDYQLNIARDEDVYSAYAIGTAVIKK